MRCDGMVVPLQNIGIMIDKVGDSVVKYPENIKSLIYSYRFRDRIIAKFMHNLEKIIDEAIKNVEDKKLSANLNDWLEAVRLLKEKPSNKNIWLRYFTSYQRVIETANDILDGTIGEVQIGMNNGISPESGSYLIQSIKLVKDVFLYFHRLTNIAKQAGVLSSPMVFVIFEDIAESFMKFSYDTQELINYINNKKELEERFVENLIDSFSALDLLLVRAYSIINIPIEIKPLSNEAEVVLSGYSVEEQNNFA